MIKEVLKDIGIPQNILGYEYLIRAIKIVKEQPYKIHRITKELYPDIARACDTTASRVERSIRHAIESAFDRSLAFDAIQRIFGNTISHFIAAVAEYLNTQEEKAVWVARE